MSNKVKRGVALIAVAVGVWLLAALAQTQQASAGFAQATALLAVVVAIPCLLVGIVFIARGFVARK